jgi:hypothetical protein
VHESVTRGRAGPYRSIKRLFEQGTVTYCTADGVSFPVGAELTRRYYLSPVPPKKFGSNNLTTFFGRRMYWVRVSNWPDSPTVFNVLRVGLPPISQVWHKNESIDKAQTEMAGRKYCAWSHLFEDVQPPNTTALGTYRTKLIPLRSVPPNLADSHPRGDGFNFHTSSTLRKYIFVQNRVSIQGEIKWGNRTKKGVGAGGSKNILD